LSTSARTDGGHSAACEIRHFEVEVGEGRLVVETVDPPPSGSAPRMPVEARFDEALMVLDRATRSSGPVAADR